MAKLYPSEELRNKLVELGIPRWKHNLAELGEMLPNYVSTSNCGGGRDSKRVGYLVCENQNSREMWVSNYMRRMNQKANFKEIFDKSEANARAKLVIYLKENDEKTP